MVSEVQQFLAGQQAVAEEQAAWGGGSIPLRISSYLSDQLPPLDYVTSVRSLVFHGEKLLVLRNTDGMHCLPGGQREQGETLEQTVCRELLEEAGWRIDRPRLLGFMHLQHQAPRQPWYRFPYPDFFWLIYAAEAAEPLPAFKLADDYEQEAAFQPIAEARLLELSVGERVFLEAALKQRAEHKGGA